MTQREEFEKEFMFTGLAEKDKPICRHFWNKGFLSCTKSTSPQWIPVSERLPELNGGPYVSKPVLAFDKYDDVVFAKYVKSGYWVIIYIDERREHGEITHWMPLPAPPEQNK